MGCGSGTTCERPADGQKPRSSLRQQITKASRRRNISSSELVRRAVLQYVSESPDPKRPASALELAGDLVGSLKGGPRDLATNPAHLDDYGQ